MATHVYPSTDTPRAPFLGIIDDFLSVPDIFTLTSMNIDIDITGPDEGFGSDYTLLEVTLKNPSATSVILANGGASSLHPANFENNLTSLQPLSAFYGTTANGTWTLTIQNFSMGAFATLNSWQLNLITPDPVNPPGNPIAASTWVLPTATYGFGGNVKLHQKIHFRSASPVTGGILGPRLVPFTGTIRNLKVSSTNSGTGNNIVVSLHKVSNGFDTVLLNQTVILNANMSNTIAMYGSDFSVNQNDMVYLSIDNGGTNSTNLAVELSLVAA